jgi:hypothetical protein
MKKDEQCQAENWAKAGRRPKCHLVFTVREREVRGWRRAGSRRQTLTRAAGRQRAMEMAWCGVVPSTARAVAAGGELL